MIVPGPPGTQPGRRHGIVIEELTADAELTVEAYRVDRITTEAKAFQNHKLVTVDVTSQQTKRTVKSGTIVVRSSQPLGTLAAYLLEPQSEDGLCAWNFFDESLKQGADYPVLRLPVAAALATRTKAPRVAVLDDQHRVHYRSVELGRDYGAEVQVLAGLKEGEQVVVHPGDDLPEGTVVAPVPLTK